MSTRPRLGLLTPLPPHDRPDLLASPAANGLAAAGVTDAWVAEIDPDLADTATFCAAYEVPLEASGNCVIVAGRRGGRTSYAACVVPATARADVNGAVRRRLGVRKASFAPMDDAVHLTGMEYGGITPLGVPTGWPILVDDAVATTEWVVIGSGLRRSKILLPGRILPTLPDAETSPLALAHGVS